MKTCRIDAPSLRGGLCQVHSIHNARHGDLCCRIVLEDVAVVKERASSITLAMVNRDGDLCLIRI